MTEHIILGFDIWSLIILILISLIICITVCTLAMGAAVFFTPFFLFIAPSIISGFPRISVNEAIGLSFIIELFGYTSSVIGYWIRKQIDFDIALHLLKITIPIAIIARIISYFVPSKFLVLIFGLALLYLAFEIFIKRKHLLEIGSKNTSYRVKSCIHCVLKEEKTPTEHKKYHLNLDFMDKTIVGAAGIAAGLIGTAIGEIINSFLLIRKKLQAKVAVGSTAFILHITILTVTALHLLVSYAPVSISGFQKPAILWSVALIIAPVVIIGGQIGSYLNSKLPNKALIYSLIFAYGLAGAFVFINGI